MEENEETPDDTSDHYGSLKGERQHVRQHCEESNGKLYRRNQKIGDLQRV